MTRQNCSTLPLPLSERAAFDLRGQMGRWVGPPIVLALAAVLAFKFDVAISLVAVNLNLPRELDELLSLGEVFGHGIGVLFVGWLIYALAPKYRWAIPRVLGVALSAGLLADVVKLFVARWRPMYFFEHGMAGSTFGRWLPLLSAQTEGQSFPSAHTATGIALALMLAWLFPRGRRIFALLGICVALQRVHCGAHYLGDTLCGATIGWTIAVASCRLPAITRLYGRIEARLQRDGESTTTAAPEQPVEQKAA